MRLKVLYQLKFVLRSQSLFRQEKRVEEVNRCPDELVAERRVMFAVWTRIHELGGAHDPWEEHALESLALGIAELLCGYDLLTSQVKNEDHLGLEVAWMIYHSDALQQLKLGLFVLPWICLQEDLLKLLCLWLLRVVEQELQTVAKQ